MNKKNIKIIVPIVIIAVALIIGVVFMTRDSSEQEESIVRIYDVGNDLSTVYKNDEVIGTVEGDAIMNTNINGSGCYMTTGTAVYSVKSDEVKEIGKNMEVIAVANNSDAALFLDSDGIMYRYDGSELEKITDKETTNGAISGDGNYYAYFADDVSYLISESGKEIKIEGMSILYISEDGKYIYATEYSGDDKYKLNVLNKDGKVEKSVDGITSIFGLNKKGTEIVYVTDKGTFIMVEGKEEKKVSDYAIKGICGETYENIWCTDFYKSDSFKGAVCTFATGEAMELNCAKISESYTAEIIIESFNELICVTKDSSKIIYLDDSRNLCNAEIKKDAEVNILAEAVDYATASPDGKDIYFVKYTDEKNVKLYCVNKDSKANELGEVKEFYGITAINGGCYIDADAIYYATKEKITLMDNFTGFFLDYSNEKMYGYDTSALYLLDGMDKTKLDGDYKTILSYECLQ